MIFKKKGVNEVILKNILKKKRRTYLTRFSEAITEVETAFPKAWSSIVS